MLGTKGCSAADVPSMVVGSSAWFGSVVFWFLAPEIVMRIDSMIWFSVSSGLFTQTSIWVTHYALVN